MVRSACFALVLFTSLLVAGCAEPPAAPAPPVVRSAECRWAAGTVRIDAQINETAWDKAQVLENFAVYWQNRKAKTATKARLLWDHRKLYFMAEMEDSDLYADVTEPNGMIWTNDVFELFLK